MWNDSRSSGSHFDRYVTIDSCYFPFYVSLSLLFHPRRSHVARNNEQVCNKLTAVDRLLIFSYFIEPPTAVQSSWNLNSRWLADAHARSTLLSDLMRGQSVVHPLPTFPATVADTNIAAFCISCWWIFKQIENTWRRETADARKKRCSMYYIT